MPDQSFLAHFINEDIYLIKEDLPEQAVVTAEPAVAPEPIAEAEPVVKVEAPTPAATPVAEKPVPAPEEVEEKPLFETPVLKEPEPVYLKPLPTEGGNLKHCLVLVESETGVLEANLKGLLEKIMSAVKRSLEDILIVNVKDASEDQLDALLSEQNHRHLLAFGTSKLTALSEVGNYEITQVNRKNYLKADSLTAISEEVALKKALWKALKEMF